MLVRGSFRMLRAPSRLRGFSGLPSRLHSLGGAIVSPFSRRRFCAHASPADPGLGEPPSTSDWLKVGFVTDIEGNLSFWRRYVERSEVLYFDEEADRSETWGCPRIRLRDGCAFVHGGDVFDKGFGDIPVVHDLVQLKRRYPDRVFLILGNRDINKMRLSTELCPSFIERQSLRDILGPYWVPAHRRGSLIEWVKRRLSREATDIDLSSSQDSLEERLERLKTPQNHLKFVLEETMGAPAAFEFRRRYLQACKLYDEAIARGLSRESLSVPELSPQRILLDPELESLLLQACGMGPRLDDIQVGDIEVYGSFLNSVTADPAKHSWPEYFRREAGDDTIVPDPRSRGIVCEYLKHAQLALVLGDSLFLHGGLRSPVLGSLPESAVDLELDPKEPPMARSRCRPFVEGGLDYRMVSEVTGNPDWKLRDWTDRINRWARAMVNEWLENPRATTDLSYRGGEDLMRYCTRHGSNGRGFVYESHMSDGHPDQLPPKVSDFLNRSGVRRLIVGHQPQGDAPTVVKTAVMELVMADTAFSDTTAPDNRGVAQSEVTLYLRTQGPIGSRPDEWSVPVEFVPQTPGSRYAFSSLRIHGVLSGGVPSSVALQPYPEDWPRFPEVYLVWQVLPAAQLAVYNFYLDLLKSQQGLPEQQLDALLEDLDQVGDPLVGRQTLDGWFVKSRVLLPNRSEAPIGPGERLPPLIAYNLSRGKGFQVDYRPQSLHELWSTPFINEFWQLNQQSQQPPVPPSPPPIAGK